MKNRIVIWCLFIVLPLCAGLEEQELVNKFVKTTGLTGFGMVGFSKGVKEYPRLQRYMKNGGLSCIGLSGATLTTYNYWELLQLLNRLKIKKWCNGKNDIWE